MPDYKVLRRQEGDRLYEEGEMRTLDAAEAKHLVDLGILREIKAEGTPKNKAESKPANKAEPASKNKAD